MNYEAGDERSTLTSKLLRQPMIVAIGLSLGIYIVLVLVYLLTGRPTKFSNLLEWLSWSILFIPAAFASILGHLKITRHFPNAPRLTFLILFYWMMPILAFSVFIAMLMILELSLILSKLNAPGLTSLQTPSIFLVSSIVTAIVWSRSAITIVMRPLLALNVDGISKNITGRNKARNLGCLITVMIGGVLFFTLTVFVTTSSIFIMLPMALLAQVLMALAAMTIYKIEERRGYLLLIIWLIPTLLVILGILLATSLITING